VTLKGEMRGVLFPGG